MYCFSHSLFLFNVISLNDGEQFEALVDIKVGEELLVDYGTIVECDE